MFCSVQYQQKENHSYQGAQRVEAFHHGLEIVALLSLILALFDVELLKWSGCLEVDEVPEYPLLLNYGCHEERVKEPAAKRRDCPN